MSASLRLTTFEIGSLYGVAPQSLRFYEDQGLLRPVIEDGTRYYTAKDRIKLELILKGKRLGFSFLDLKLLILDAIDKNACRDASSADAQPVPQASERQKLVEEIWQAERSIEEMQARIADLRRSLDQDA